MTACSFEPLTEDQKKLWATKVIMKPFDIFDQYSKNNLFKDEEAIIRYNSDNSWEEIDKKNIFNQYSVIDKAYKEMVTTGKSTIKIENVDIYDEIEPTKIHPHIPGTKLDQDKPDLDLVLGDFAKALQEVGKIGTFGAKKYSEHGWLSVPNASRRYSSAMWRHIFQYKEGKELDNESGFSHLSHAAWNALAVLELYLRSKNEM